jgi:hypothetical protein
MFRISDPDGGAIYVQSREQIEAAIRSSPPGRYDIDRIGGVALSADGTPRPWGFGTKIADGTMTLKVYTSEA